MKATMNVAITKPGGGIKLARKTVDLPFVPYIGMEIECIAWKEARKVLNVTLSFDPDYKDPSLYIYMGKEEAKDEKGQDYLSEMYKGHDWAIVGE